MVRLTELKKERVDAITLHDIVRRIERMYTLLSS